MSARELLRRFYEAQAACGAVRPLVIPSAPLGVEGWDSEDLEREAAAAGGVESSRPLFVAVAEAAAALHLHLRGRQAHEAVHALDIYLLARTPEEIAAAKDELDQAIENLT
jgi:hypothetical protein